MIRYKTLEDTETEVLHGCFLEAFSDYEIDMNIPFPHFKRELGIRGFVPELSMGAFDEGELVGFVMNGVRDWYGTRTAYDVFTGVIPEYRRQGISTNIFRELTQMLKENDIQQYLLEVFQTNEGAVDLYKKKGFEVSREFECYRNHNPYELTVEDLDDMIPSDIEDLDWDRVRELWDFKPSWQNSIQAIHVFPDLFEAVKFTNDDELHGYGIIDRKVGNIPQIALSEGFKNKEMLKKIIAALLEDKDFERISVINVEKAAEFMNDALDELGFELVAQQYEMVLEL